METRIIVSCVFAVIQVSLWWMYKYNLAKDFVNRISEDRLGEDTDDLIKDLIDLMPCFLCLAFFTPYSAFFLLGCLVADNIISDCVPLGGLMFLIVYGVSAVRAIGAFPPDVVYLSISAVCVLVAIIIVMSVWNTNLMTKIGSTLYGMTALVLLLTAFFHTRNIGFLSLVIGDILLTIKEIVRTQCLENADRKARLVMSVSNSFYYLGVCLVPLTLCQLG